MIRWSPLDTVGTVGTLGTWHFGTVGTLGIWALGTVGTLCTVGSWWRRHKDGGD